MSQAVKITDRISAQRNDISDRDFRFYQLDKIIRISQFLEKDRDCKDCRLYLENIFEFIDNLPDNLSDRKKRMMFDGTIEKTLRHLRKIHGFYLEKYFNYNYTVLGMFAGLATGIFISYIITEYSKAPIIIAGWLTGLIAGRITGNILDKRIKKESRQM